MENKIVKEDENSKISNMDDDVEAKKIASLTSSDPNERKLARRLRIQRRLENAERQEEITKLVTESVPVEHPLIDETIETSEDVLRQLFFEGKDLISNIRVASDAKEVERRIIEAEEKNTRLEQLKEESTFALKKLNEISTKWEAIVDSSGPLELNQHMIEQKARCLELIQQKNDVIKNFQTELKIADEKFMKDRKTMFKEMSLLTKRIDEQVLLMKKAYRIELEHIEESVDITRTQIMEKHQKTWQTLYNQREKDEVTNMNRKFSLVENFHEELYQLHQQHEEKYRETRIQLEKNIQMLEQELEQVKALCLLNSEKLDYNYQVLKKREEENVYIKNHQKRRLNKLQDIVNNLKKKIEEKKNSVDEELKKLSKEVDRYYTNIIDLGKRGDHFAQVNEEKYQNIWDMKDEEAKDLLHKILSIDKVIHEQILGLTWVLPTYSVLNKKNLTSYRTGAAVVNSTKKSEKKSKMKKSQKDRRAIMAGSKTLLRHILELIADQTGFLVEEKLDELLKPYSEEEKIFVRLDNVFAALGINNEYDLETMKTFFKPFSTCPQCEKSNAVEENEEVRADSSSLLNARRDSSSVDKQYSVLQMRELEEKVSTLRIQAKKEKARSSIEGEKSENSIEVSPSNQEDDLKSFKDMDDSSSQRKGYKETESKASDISKTQSNEDLCPNNHPLIIEKIYVLKALKNFVSNFHANKCRNISEMGNRLTKKRFTISRILSKPDVSFYWEKYKELLPPNVENIWKAIFVSLTRYFEILQVRHKLNVKAESIRRQNIDLKRLLAVKSDKSQHESLILPALPEVPDGPIDPEELSRIAEKLAF